MVIRYIFPVLVFYAKKNLATLRRISVTFVFQTLCDQGGKGEALGAKSSVTRDRCYDFKNIFRQKILRKKWRSLLKLLLVFAKKS
jgi:hypothetical protein